MGDIVVKNSIRYAVTVAIAMALLVSVWLVFIYRLNRPYFHRADIAKSGVVVEAEIVDAWVSKGEHRVQFRYHDQSGKSHEHSLNVSPEEFAGMKKGSFRPMRYLTNDPDLFLVSGIEVDPSSIYLVSTLVLSVVLL